MRATLAAALALAAVAVAPHALADPKTRLVLNALEGEDIDAGLLAVSEVQLCSALGEDARFETVCPDDVRAVAEVAKFSAAIGSENCKDDKCLAAIGEMMHADQVITGGLARADKQLVLTLVRHDAKTGKELARVVEKLPETGEALLKKLPQVAKRLLSHAPASPPPVAGRSPAPP